MYIRSIARKPLLAIEFYQILKTPCTCFLYTRAFKSFNPSPNIKSYIRLTLRHLMLDALIGVYGIEGGCTCIKRGCICIKRGCTPIITLYLLLIFSAGLQHFTRVGKI